MPERPIVCAPCVRRTLCDRRAELDEARRAHATSRTRLERAMTATGGRDRAEGPRAALAAERARNAAEDLRRARAENARIESAIRDERDGLARAREALTARAAALATARRDMNPVARSVLCFALLPIASPQKVSSTWARGDRCSTCRPVGALALPIEPGVRRG